jgi:hypothetical protein
MSEQKKIITDTEYIGYTEEYDIQDDSIALSVIVNADSEAINSQIRKAEVNLNPNRFVNNVAVNEGDLYAIIRGRLDNHFDLELNDNGELIIHGKDAENFSLDDEGNLIYTEK